MQLSTAAYNVSPQRIFIERSNGAGVSIWWISIQLMMIRAQGYTSVWDSAGIIESRRKCTPGTLCASTVFTVIADWKKQAPVPRPRLERVDGKLLRKEDLERRRFGITIQSVYYYSNPGSRSVCCAVLLKTSFELSPGDKLCTHMLSISRGYR